MRIIILFFTITILLSSCGSNPKPISKNGVTEKTDIVTNDLSKSGLRLKIGPTWFNNESEIHFVYGVSEESIRDNYITELHFNFGGKIKCQNKALSAIFDFKNAKDLILSDSINKLLPATKNIIQRKQENSSVKFNFKNPSPGILMFAIEKVNLKPDTKQNRIALIIKSQCQEYLNLPIILTKYSVSEVDELVNNYIQKVLNSLSESELKTLKVIFSYNQILKTEEFLIDMVDQRNMQILNFDSVAKEFILTDFEKNVIRKIKHGT